MAKMRSSSSFSFFSASIYGCFLSKFNISFSNSIIILRCSLTSSTFTFSILTISSSRTFHSVSLSLNNKIFSLDNSCILVAYSCDADMGGATMRRLGGSQWRQKSRMGHHSAATVSYSARNGCFLQSQGGSWPTRPTPWLRPWMLMSPSSFPLSPHLSSWDVFLWSYPVKTHQEASCWSLSLE
jgi:hypothetical protein